MVPEECAVAQDVAEAWLSLSRLAFLQSQTPRGFFHLPPVLHAFCFQTIWAELKLAFSFPAPYLSQTAAQGATARC